VIAGDFEGTIDFGGGPLACVGASDGFIAKLDRYGNHIWSRRFGDEESQIANALAVDGPGDIVLAGSFSGTVDFGGGPLVAAGSPDAYIVKLDASGNHLWSKRFGDGDNQSSGEVAFDGSGNIFMTGVFGGTIDFGGGPLAGAGFWDAYVVKLDAQGGHLWSKRFGNAGWMYIAVDGSGDLFMAGSFSDIVDFGGGPLACAGKSDIFIAKLDRDGNHLWSERFGDADYGQYPSALAVDAAGNVLMVGHFRGSVDFGGGPLTCPYLDDIFLVKFDPGGGHLWSKRFGTIALEMGKGVAVDREGNIVITGLFNDSVDFGGGLLTTAGETDIYAARFDADGLHVWSKSFGGPQLQSGSCVTSDGTGNFVIGGLSRGAISFGGGVLPAGCFVAKFGTW